MDVLPTIDDALGFGGVYGDGVAEVNCELTDKGECCGIGCGEVYSVEF